MGAAVAGCKTSFIRSFVRLTPCLVRMSKTARHLARSGLTCIFFFFPVFLMEALAPATPHALLWLTCAL